MYSNVKEFKKQTGGKSLAPFGWVGGKSKLAPWIVDHIPEHTQYVEVFGGALNLLWAKKPSKIEVVNDIDSDLISLYRIIKNHPESLNNKLQELLFSRELFNLLKSKEITHRNRNHIERAAHTYYVISTSFGAKRESYGRGKLPKSGKQKHGHVKRIYRDFAVWSRRLRTVQIENLSFEKMLKDYDHTDSFFYLDPPYFGTENYYVGGSFSRKDHERLAELLKGVEGKWLLSYNDHPTLRELYKDFYITQTPEIGYSLSSSSRQKKLREIIITNYAL